MFYPDILVWAGNPFSIGILKTLLYGALPPRGVIERCDVTLTSEALGEKKKNPNLWKAAGCSLVPVVLKLCDNIPWSNVLSSSWIFCNTFNLHMRAL